MGVPPGQGQVILTIQEINTSLESTDARGGLFMKRKVGTLIEEDVIKLAKRRAIEENRPLSDLIQDALIGEVHSFVGQAPQSDDITVMIIVRE